jgi:hypothetical protein
MKPVKINTAYHIDIWILTKIIKHQCQSLRMNKGRVH